ncbi:hypothetical protein DXG01_004897 [Tephrocybe rancida]|nr:hypothetical protein DXG01_004897 [Tephrocybe rancida]
MTLTFGKLEGSTSKKATLECGNGASDNPKGFDDQVQLRLEAQARMRLEKQIQLRLKELTRSELVWSKHYKFLADYGYTLGKRYKPGWVPSWSEGNKQKADCEDGVPLLVGHTIYATRPDGTLVAVKKIDTSRSTNEATIGKLFSEPGLALSTRNHCVPVLDVLYPPEDPKLAFIVMPLLYDVCLAPFKDVGAAVDFIFQVFEGLQFMHQNGVVHGDCKRTNIMADLRANQPVKYYLVGFHNSTLHGAQDSVDNTPGTHYDRFAEDVRCIANTLKEHFLDGYEQLGLAPKEGFEFMRPLISDMMLVNARQRPSMHEVVRRFLNLVDGLGDLQLLSPVKTVGKPYGVYNSITHWTKQAGNVARGVRPFIRINGRF